MDSQAFRSARLLDWVQVDDDGLQQEGDPQSRVRWSNVLRIALVFVPDVWADEDYFWAIQSEGSLVLLPMPHPVFESVLRTRFSAPQVPAPARWADQEEPRSYVLWPPTEIGSRLRTDVSSGHAG